MELTIASKKGKELNKRIVKSIAKQLEDERMSVKPLTINSEGDIVFKLTRLEQDLEIINKYIQFKKDVLKT